MKTSIPKCIYFLLTLLYFTNTSAQNSQPVYSPDGKSGSLTLNSTDCNYPGWAYSWEITVPVNVPIKITYTNYIDCLSNVYANENGSTYLFVQTYDKYTSNSFVSKSGIIYVYCEDMLYEPLNNEPVFNISFSVDDSFITQENAYVKGNSIINGKLGIGISMPKKTLDIAGDVGISAVNKQQAFSLYSNNSSGYTYGLYNQTTSRTSSSVTYGMYSSTQGTHSSTGNVYGLYNYAYSANSSTGNIYGVYSSISGGKNKWSGYFTGGDVEVNAGRIITQPSGISRDMGYNGQIMITKPAASAQYINLVRSGQYPWSIGTVYNTSKFAIGTGTASESSFTNPFFVIDPNGGNVGIGTTMPQAKLDVNGKVFLRTFESIAGWSHSYLNWEAHSLVMGTPVGTYAHNSIDLKPGGVSQEPLFSQIRMYTSTNENQHTLNIQLNSNGTCFFNNPGNIGIGTTNPQNKLDVKGTIRATEVKVESVDKFADFVFDKDYALPTLNEVHAYIQDKGHLPNIPSAKEVKENGMSLVEMNVKLLQKVEELTLYAIEQQKRIDEQQARINEQQKQIDELKCKVK
ncbi:MAG: hypothetical protein QM751_04675 [Paludibacteraceae bacterium]